MSDIYKIPGDNGKDFRLRKFVEYQHEVPSIHYRFLGEYIKRHIEDKNEVVYMCYLMSVTYNELTSILLFYMLKTKNPEDVWRENKQSLEFGSARKYAKSNDQFVQLIRDWKTETKGREYNWLLNKCGYDPNVNYKSIQRAIMNIKNVGRFAADLFMEMIVFNKDVLGVNVSEPLKIDWKNCANLTSGIYNIFYEDERANLFDKTKKVSDTDKKYLSSKLMTIQNEIRKTYPEQNSEISMFIGKICSFRNLFKNARYGGYHHDRELGWLKAYEKSFPEFENVWTECYKIRSDIFPDRFLGEKHGWEGIRKERKKMWLTTGRTGAEDE